MFRWSRSVIGIGMTALIAICIWGTHSLVTSHIIPDIAARFSVCPPAAPLSIDTIVVPAGPVAGLCQDRLVNAAYVIAAARSLGIGSHTQTIGIMTALGESGLRNLDHGDAAGADSRGIFQQRANGAWGSITERMNPYSAARNFFLRLVSLPNWKKLSPGQAAHDVQVNADPNHYDRYWNDAETIVNSLTS